MEPTISFVFQDKKEKKKDTHSPPQKEFSKSPTLSNFQRRHCESLAINRQLTPTLNPVEPSSRQPGPGTAAQGLPSCVAFTFISSPLGPKAARRSSDPGRRCCRNVTETRLLPTVQTLSTPGSGRRRALLQKAKRAKLRFHLGSVPTIASSLSGVKTQAGVRCVGSRPGS